MGLPIRDGLEKPIFDYENILYDAHLVNVIIQAQTTLPSIKLAYLCCHFFQVRNKKFGTSFADFYYNK
jgi:hypothetical protein